MRIIKAQARKDGLYLMLEGRGDQRNILNVKSPRSVKAGADVMIVGANAGEQSLQIVFNGSGKDYVKREILLAYK